MVSYAVLILLYISLFIAIGLFGLLFISLLYLYYIHKINEHLPGPPRSSFILGNLPAILEYKKAGKSFMYFVDNHLAYGPIYLIFLVHQPVVLLGDPSYIKKVIIDHHEYACKDKPLYQKIGFMFGERFVGTNLLTETDNASWRKRRQLMNPAFHRKCLKNFISDFNKVCDKFLVKMTEIVERNEEISMVKEFAKVTLDVISQVLFNINIKAIEDPHSPFAKTIILALRGVCDNLYSPLNPMLLSLFKYKLFQSASQKEQIDAAKFLRQFAFECVTKRINDVNDNKEVPEDLLSLLTSDKSLSMEDIIDEFITIFIAGQETTANSLAFALYAIAQNPHIETKLLNEISNVLGNKDNVDFEDILQLKYVGQIFLESLRKYPVANGPVRSLSKEITVGGYRLPIGTGIECSKYFLCHNPEIWENPDVFDSERFSKPEKIPQFNSVYFPFSLGPRNCIGQMFAKFEIKVILARLLRKFKFQLVPGQTDKIEERLTVAPRDGVVCKVTWR